MPGAPVSSRRATCPARCARRSRSRISGPPLIGQDGADELLAELESAAHQVFLARKFYNDAVANTRAARAKPLARVLRLAGGAELPEFFEIDDSLVAEGSGGADMQRLAG